ncbi:MAG: hypothetical protein II007_00075 [Gammaproteobacteria bacterium]|nr:hypothetical protein [Gammaproteobacteria bacterium]
MRSLLAILTLTAALLTGCTTTETAEAPAAAPAAPAGKKTCAVDADCGDGRICVKPEAADYGFCL